MYVHLYLIVSVGVYQLNEDGRPKNNQIELGDWMLKNFPHKKRGVRRPQNYSTVLVDQNAHLTPALAP